jgi:protein TonB
MKRFYLLSFLLLSCLMSIAQRHDTSSLKTDDPRLVSHLTSVPEFPGGAEPLDQFIKKNLQYPQMERDNDIQGIVKVSFLIDENGEVKNPKVVKSVSPGLDKEALRVVKLMPKWEPGMYRKKPVPVYYVLNLTFAITK